MSQNKRNRAYSSHTGTLDQGDSTEHSSEREPKRVRWDSEDVERLSTEEDDQEGADSNNSEPGKLYLAVNAQFGRVGGAYYDPTTCTIYVLDDSQETGHYDLTKMLLDQAQPDVVLTSSKGEDSCMDILHSYMDGTGGSFQVRPHKDFIPAKGRDRILSLRLLSELPEDRHIVEGLPSSSSEDEPRSAYDFMRRRKETTGDPNLQKWNACIRLANYASIEGSPLCLGSVGALLDHLSKVRVIGELHDEGISGLDIRAIQYLAFRDVMQINADALYSLQVFDNESHASIHSDKTKEGLSLFGILDYTKTSLGKALLRQWLLRPSLSRDVIVARHDAVACFIRPENATTIESMHVHMKGIKNVPKILAVIKSGRAKVSDWQSLVKFAFHSVMLHEALSELDYSGRVEIVRKLCKVLDVAGIRYVGNVVNETIDWEESRNAARVCVRPHIDEDLDKLKHIYHGIDTVLSKVAERVSATVPIDYATTLNVVYFPQLGFLICVPMQDDWRENGVDVMEGWSFQFSSDVQVYFKSQEMHDLDRHIGDIHSSIVDREIEIVQELLERVIKYEQEMTAACDMFAELDCLLSFAEASRALDFHQPELSDENVIIIKQGRHPLQEMVVDTFVPNDTFLIGSDCSPEVAEALSEEHDLDDSVKGCKNSVMISTGANACGKSVYLKQVALIQYMAQIGCFIPAQSAILGITDRIFTRIQTRESVSRVQSAFMIDLNQVSLALRDSTERSLILLDEFGKGTVSSDGAALFCGVLKHLINRGSSCPKVIAATHFHEVFQEGMLDPGELPVTFVHMQVLLTSSRGEVLGISTSEASTESGATEDDDMREGNAMRPSERITYLYKIGRGLSKHSHAAVCAELFGIPRPIARRAQYVSYLLSKNELGTLLDEEMTEDERLELQLAEEICRRFLACDLEAERELGTRQLLAQILGREETIENDGMD
ncbi:uncharacterized protein PHACADRAFT_262157 [Phanerochaete carnosa HHB-10118-sp]|uniref:DNA mismatch repair proteins mutS family domain-containing protein n=1 Tax=Phanerochaete carnosa (strain HHB-10118-sp) TaxID=650164 RepID=K5VZ02_PHACS|nr:uncharacterized protein PHACADRAFT_262157 [Phanerochaete carnosa HHB-10118-sp]EKM51809.1 hypothetical protein PHACADRAFT_262157 [Phanerochaete carnosa HHB-10118-sp]